MTPIYSDTIKTIERVSLEEKDSYDLVLLHGLFGNLSNWKYVSEAFSEDHTVHAPLLPLFEIPLIGDRLDHLVDFLKNYLDRCNIRQAVLIGNSLGGHLALLFALKYPGIVLKLVLTGSSGLYENSFNGTFPRIRDYDYIREKVKYTFYKEEVVTEELVDEVYRIIQSPRKTLAVISLARSAQKRNLSSHLGKIRIPVLLIWGLQDKITPPEIGLRFSNGLINAKLKYIDQCGHVPMMEQPVLFNRYLKEFLEN